jgi:hypothetical protein
VTSFYKYLTSSRLDVVVDRTLRFTQAAALNDPFELRPYFEQILDRNWLAATIDAEPIDLQPSLKKLYRELPEAQRRAISQTKFLRFAEAELRANPDESARIIAETKSQMLDLVSGLAQWARDEFYGQAGRLVGILSLSETAENGLMWSHYAEQHKGLVVEFDGKNAFFDQRRTADDDHYVLRPVLYPAERPRYKDLLQLDRNSVYLTKGYEWRYEREHRMTIPLSLHQPLDNSATEPIYLLSYPPDALRSVTVGARARDETVNHIQDVLRNDAALAHVSLRRAILDTESGAIVIVPVSG